ncbi:M20/M25/M40 family metallo-hydrolase, partial [Candidatus Omnitrophota bacterium]
MVNPLRLIIIALVTFIVLKSSTFGWNFFAKSFSPPEKEDSRLANSLEFHVRKLSDEIGDRSVFNYEKLNEAARYITQALRSFGYSVEFQNYTVSDKEVKNIIATRRGTKNPKEIIIVGAHYDTCFNPGADDNASAVAGLLELARCLSDQQTARSVRFIAFVNEESPFFTTDEMGSMVYLKKAKAEGEDIKAALILEMIGYYTDKPNSQRYPFIYGFFYPNKGNFLA